MDLYLIRHAQSTNNALTDQRERVCDPPLTQLGERQAELLARHLAEGLDRQPAPVDIATPVDLNGHRFAITRLICSPMRRALQTARPMAARLALVPEIWTDIHEQGGIWLDRGEPEGITGYPGMTRDELARDFPGYVIPDEITPDGWWRGAYEPREAVMDRAERVAARLHEIRMSEERLAMVTHGGFTFFLMRALMCAAPEPELYFHHDNTGVSLLRFRMNGTISVRYSNRLDHLPPEMVS